MIEPVFHGSVVLRETAGGDLEIGATHVGGFVRYDARRGQLTVVEKADLLDLLVAMHRMYPTLADEARDIAMRWSGSSPSSE